MEKLNSLKVFSFGQSIVLGLVLLGASCSHAHLVTKVRPGYFTQKSGSTKEPKPHKVIETSFIDEFTLLEVENNEIIQRQMNEDLLARNQLRASSKLLSNPLPCSEEKTIIDYFAIKDKSVRPKEDLRPKRTTSNPQPKRPNSSKAKVKRGTINRKETNKMEISAKKGLSINLLTTYSLIFESQDENINSNPKCPHSKRAGKSKKKLNKRKFNKSGSRYYRRRRRGGRKKFWMKKNNKRPLERKVPAPSKPPTTPIDIPSLQESVDGFELLNFNHDHQEP